MQKLLAPFKLFKPIYIPLLAVYFAAGFSSLDAITRTFFVKNQLTLSADALIGLSIWISLPWSIKMVFGSIIDGIPILGNNRKSYIYLGASLIAFGSLAMFDIASTHHLTSLIGEYGALLVAGLLSTGGIVISDIVADTMSVELVEKDENHTYNLGMIQILSRLVFSIGSVTAAAITGTLAAKFSAPTVFLISLAVPAIMIVGTLFIKIKPIEGGYKLNKFILLGGTLFGVFCALVGLFIGEYSQLVVFCGSMLVVNYMMWTLTREIDSKVRGGFILACIAIFMFRVTPSTGPAIDWWCIDALKFDQEFMGLIRLVSQIVAMVSLWILSDKIAKSSIRTTMLVLTIIGTLFSLPEILVYYGLHETVGLTARQLLLTSNSILVPLSSISMIPLGVLIARNVPQNQRASYMALTASFMNMALVGGDVITQQLSKLFIITRTDFSQVGNMLTCTLVIGTIFSIFGLILLRSEK